MHIVQTCMHNIVMRRNVDALCMHVPQGEMSNEHYGNCYMHHAIVRITALTKYCIIVLYVCCILYPLKHIRQKHARDSTNALTAVVGTVKAVD